MKSLKFTIVSEIKMASIEIEKILIILHLRHLLGYNQVELSFLLGLRNYYIRDIENLLITLDYSVPNYNFLGNIFKQTFRQLLPVYKSHSEIPIHRLSTATDETGLVYYRIERTDKNGNWQIIKTLSEEPKDLLLDSPNKFTPEEIKAWVDKKQQGDYFKTARTAFDIFKDCQKELKGPVRPMHLSDALVKHAKNKKTPKIIKSSNEMGRFVFKLEENVV